MKNKILAFLWVAMFVLSAMGYAVDDQSSSGTPTPPQSLGGQAGEAARELKGTADESYMTGMTKVGEASRKMEADARDAFKTLQEQWNVLAQQLQEKTQQISKQLQASAQKLSEQAQKQSEDFNKSFQKPSKS